MVIAHLYSDLLNLYGNDGNIKILVNKLKQIGEDVEVVYPTVKDNMEFEKYDFIYMGSGTEGNQEIAIEDLKRYENEISKVVEENKIFLITGNSIDIFGKELVGEKTIRGLGIFNYTSKYVPRIRKDVLYKASFLENPILGYENHNYILESNEHPLWEDQGIKYNEFYGTYTEGPILVRNPEFLKYFISKLVTNKDNLEKLDLELETKAYNNFRMLLNHLEK
ncbi:MAG: hypothetical protein IJ220_06825 [Clostridia bacterium]|nr:hypothetical protein [Clostridia bacterium]